MTFASKASPAVSAIGLDKLGITNPVRIDMQKEILFAARTHSLHVTDMSFAFYFKLLYLVVERP